MITLFSEIVTSGSSQAAHSIFHSLFHHSELIILIITGWIGKQFVNNLKRYVSKKFKLYRETLVNYAPLLQRQ